MASSVDAHKRQVARSLDGSNLGLLVARELEVLVRSLVVGSLAGPLECLCPGEVTEPVANVIGITLLTC